MPHLRNMHLSDINQVVGVHLSSFQGFFLTFLGARFLSLLYSYIACSTDGAGYVVADEKDGIIGFVCGSTKPSGFYRRFFKKQWLHIVLATLWPVVRDPSIAPRLVWRVLNPPQPSTHPGTATLMAIAVLPGYQNKGIGRVLVQAFLNEMQRRGMRRVNLITDRDGNDAVNAFYRRLGFQRVRSFVTPEGRWMDEYVISLSEGEFDA